MEQTGLVELTGRRVLLVDKSDDARFMGRIAVSAISTEVGVTLKAIKCFRLPFYACPKVAVSFGSNRSGHALPSPQM